MSKTVLPAQQERSRKTLALLLKATIEVLNKDGLEGATVPRIAARAGLTPGAIYRRFPDKDALLREVCLRMLEENYRNTRELLSPERWKDKPLAEICRYVIEVTLKGHLLLRGLMRAYLFFTLQHPDVAFVRKCDDLEWKTIRVVSDLLLTRRKEIRHPDPDFAVSFAILMVGAAAHTLLVLPRDAKHFSRLVPDLEKRLERELPEMILRYLRIED